jgi:GTP-binding protein
VKFIDEATITVQSGDGGSGCVSFRREKFIPRGGPDGGDGGKGGDVILKSTSARRTLLPFRYRSQFKAKRGANGQGKQKTGSSGQALILEVPPGTIVRNAETGEILKDFSQPDEAFVVARGGRGGQGNLRFKSSTHRSPRFAQPGEPGQILTLSLELKLLADVGLIGLPNAGKSTLISVISAAKPKIADYPFTTLVPVLGVVQAGRAEPFVVADIPGLIEGAHQGAGLGDRFLRHVERTRLLVHVVDAAAIETDNPLAAYETINGELGRYSPALAQKPQIVVLNKMDLPGTQAAADQFSEALPGLTVLQISAATGNGIAQLLKSILSRLEQLEDNE